MGRCRLHLASATTSVADLPTILLTNAAGWLRITQAYVRSLQDKHAQDQAHLLPMVKVAEGHESAAFRAALDV